MDKDRVPKKLVSTRLGFGRHSEMFILDKLSILKHENVVSILMEIDPQIQGKTTKNGHVEFVAIVSSKEVIHSG